MHLVAKVTRPAEAINSDKVPQYWKFDNLKTYIGRLDATKKNLEIL
jgi:hypothetical protein